MTVLMFIFWVILIIIVVKKINSQTEKINRLTKTIQNLQNDFYEMTSESPGRVAEPAEEPPPFEPEAADQEISGPGPSVSYAQYTRPTVDGETAPPEETVEPEQPLAETEQTFSEEPYTTDSGQSSVPYKTSSVLYERWLSFKATVDWEQFTGVKLFAWLGGLALFIAGGFFVKFSIDQNLIPPALRLAVSALIGIGLIIAAGFFSKEKYTVMRHTLAAAGIGVLYSVVFAATLYYQYLTNPLGFGLLAIISATAFVLAAFYQSRAVSILGAAGAYITPLLVHTGQGNLPLLFAYLAIVNIGIYRVARRLVSQGLILVAVAGTVVTLGLGTWDTFDKFDDLIIAILWLSNLFLFTLFLGLSNADPKENLSTRWAGILAFLSTLIVAVSLLTKNGYPCMLVTTLALAASMALAWRNRGWHLYVIPYAAISFLVALIWVLFVFDPTEFSIGFLLILFYGLFGGLGPLLLLWQYGLNRSTLFWFRVFPLAIVCISLAVLFQEPAVSIWFWPLLLILELIGIGISVIFRAFIQVVLLVLLFVIGALQWIFHVPGEMLGIGFFLFIIGAGILSCAGLFLLIKRLPDVLSRLQLQSDEAGWRKPVSEMPYMAQWLAASPAAGVCALLAASFLINYPHYPHPGMVTLVCFLILVLFSVHRLGFGISGTAALLGTAGAQAVFVFHPLFTPPVFLSALVWSGALFFAALLVPFFFFRSFEQWKPVWSGWALFEAAQAFFILYITQSLWPVQQAQWVTLILAVLKLPLVAILLRRLQGSPERNVILAFHGGVLLFYLSTLPVLVLDHGWIGLTFMFEAAALLWLNRRIEHPGLRWVAWAMAPTGLLILIINLPLLKTTESLPIINSATLSMIFAVTALVFAVRHAGYPQRNLSSMNLPNYFLWLAVGTGFFLVNLIVADLFAQPGTRFNIWPGQNFVQWACYALSWVGLGTLVWRLTRLSSSIRLAGLFLVFSGSLFMISLPILLPDAAVRMRPILNTGTAVYIPLLAMLYYSFHKEPWNDPKSLTKNLLLALFLTAGFIALKLQSGIFFATGYPFTLLFAHTPAKAAASAAGWMAYGLGLHIWPKRLDRPFRIAGMILIVIALIKALALPFNFRVEFTQMTPLLNPPTLVYLFCIVSLTLLTIRKWDQRWPVAALTPRAFWGITLAVVLFCVLNIEIASVFSIKGRPFSMMTHGILSMQLAYSIGWLLFAIGLMAVGIRWDQVKVRWAAIGFIVLTACKIFILDVRSLDQLYRVFSLVGLAVVLGLVSFLYQRFLSEGKKDA